MRQFRSFLQVELSDGATQHVTSITKLVCHGVACIVVTSDHAFSVRSSLLGESVHVQTCGDINFVRTSVRGAD